MLLENKKIIKYNAQHKIMRWDGLNKNQINKSLKLIKKCKSEKFDSISKTDWKIDKNEKREYFDYLWKECLEPFKESFSNLWGGRKLILHNYWFQIYSKNDEHDWHTHTHSNFTNILYLQNTDETQTELYGMNFTNNAPTIGSILTFPAFYLHKSSCHNNKKPKIIVSFNTSIQ